MDYLANFAKTGNPNGAGLPVWKKWSNKEGKSKVIEFDATFDEALLEMTNEEVTIPGVWNELTAELATWDDIYGPGTEAAWGWLPWWFQWSTPE